MPDILTATDEVLFTGTGDSCTEVTAFLGGSRAGHTHQWKSRTNDGGYVVTAAGRQWFRPGDTIVRYSDGSYGVRFALGKILGAWAQSFPWDCLVRPTRCASATHAHDPMVDQPCAVPDCGEPIRDREPCYQVTELEGWVCFRHVDPGGPCFYPL